MIQTVYLLSDPRTGEPRYVGVTSRRLEKRIAQHRSQAINGVRLPVCDWHRKLIAQGLAPHVSVLEQTGDRAREAHWIAHYRSTHTRMLNLADGGNEAPSSNPVVAAKIAIALTGRKLSPAHLEKCRNRPRLAHSEETKEKMRKPKTPEHRENARRAVIAKRLSGDFRVPYGTANGAYTRPDRVRRGADNGIAKLTDDQVIEMRSRNAAGESTTALAASFGISQATAWKIVRGLCWAHLPGAVPGPGKGSRRHLAK